MSTQEIAISEKKLNTINISIEFITLYYSDLFFFHYDEIFTNAKQFEIQLFLSICFI